MTFSPLHQFAISIEKQGPRSISKASFPLRYGKYSQIRTPDFEFRFNLNGEIKFIRGLNTAWPNPAEQLKRTDGNDWVYYSVGDQSGDNGIISWLGEYYLPCLPYQSNPVWEVDYLSNPDVMSAMGAWSQLYADLYMAPKERLAGKIRNFINLVLRHDDNILLERSRKLNDIIGGRVSVLPPDTRHVDYEVIPLNIADGCLYRCKFCCVKTNRQFEPRSQADIVEQIRQLKHFYGRNLENYNALFLGNHDALAAGGELICFAAAKASEVLQLNRSDASLPMLFLFGSVDALLKSERALFDRLNSLPFYTYINIGFESADASTLAFIHKPLSEPKVTDAFQKMLDLNAACSNLEITGNFLMGEHFSSEHYHAMADLLASEAVPAKGKGAIYLSPLKSSLKRRELLPQFYEVKNKSRLPVHTYLIQRL